MRNFKTKSFLDFLFFVFFVSLFLRAEFMTVNVGGFGIKLFHVLPMICAFFVFLTFYKDFVFVNSLPSSVWFFLFVFFVYSFVCFFIYGPTPGYVRGVFYVFLFVVSFAFHSAIRTYARSQGVDFSFYYSKLISFCVIFVLFLFFIKNIYYLPDLLGQARSGVLRPRTEWNFMNIGYSINNEVVFGLMLLPFMYVGTRSLISIVLGFSVVVMAFLTKVDAAYLYMLFVICIVLSNYFSVLAFFENRFFLWLVLIVAPFLFELWFAGNTRDGLEGGELGRYMLWSNALDFISEMNLISFLFGGVNLETLIAEFPDIYLIGHDVKDFHNLYFNSVFEYGVLFILIYLWLFIRPVFGAVLVLGYSHYVSIFIIFTVLSSWFTPRGFDYLFWFFVPALFVLAYDKQKSKQG